MVLTTDEEEIRKAATWYQGVEDMPNVWLITNPEGKSVAVTDETMLDLLLLAKARIEEFGEGRGKPWVVQLVRELLKEIQH